jgi:endoglucanase
MWLDTEGLGNQPSLLSVNGLDPMAIDPAFNSMLLTDLTVNTVAHRPTVNQVYMVATDIMAVEIVTGQVVPAKQTPYQPQPGDRKVSRGIDTWVERQGQLIGTLVGKDQAILYPLDGYSGQPLDTAWADQPKSYLLSSKTDPDYQLALNPTAVHRKSKPTNMAMVGDWQFKWPLQHTIYLDFANPLEVGKTYDLRFSDPLLGTVAFSYQPTQAHSEAVHVSHLGFRSDDPLKIGYLSTWMGSSGGIDYPDNLAFWLIDDTSGQQVYKGQSVLVRPLQESEDPRMRDYTLTEVQSFDFSQFSQPGRYRLCVDGIGCSLTFDIGQAPWQTAFYTSARGFYHQRSGIAIESPYSTYTRPRGFYPGTGPGAVTVYQSRVSLMETSNGFGDQPDAFSELLKHKTNEIVPNAWGGYFDAGDWDRRIQHLDVARNLLELTELFPEYFATVNLNIPESANTLPDTIDEALWGLEFFRRLQTSDGGIRGGIESAEHPKRGETSWQESLTVMAYAPDMWSSYFYAGVASRAAYALSTLNPSLAHTYRDSAIKAMNYAEAEYSKALSQGKALNHDVLDKRNLAALELFRLTGDDKWHAIFLATTVFQDPAAGVYVYGSHQQRDAAFLYARLSEGRIDRTVQQNARSAFLREADTLGDISRHTGFGWTKNEPWEPIVWGNSFGAPKTITLLRAHTLSGEEKYLQDAIRATQFSLGANPDNMTYTTGLGHRSPQNPLLLDQRITGQAPPPGITVYGPLDMVEQPTYWMVDLLKTTTFPTPTTWPTTETYFDVFLFPAATEFTVMETMANAAYTWGYLAARR